MKSDDHIFYRKYKQMLDMSPGMLFKDNKGYEWIRMQDSIDHHLEGFYCNTTTGEWKHASYLAL